MTTEQKKQVIKEAYYMTQYAAYTSDEGVYEALIESLEENETDFDLVIEFLEMTKNASDSINQKVYDSVFYSLTDEKIERLIKLYEAIENESINDLEELFNISIYDLYDGYVGDYDFFEMIADEDLKMNGYSSNAIYWAKNIPTDDGLYHLDIYNDFNEIVFDDVLDLILDSYGLSEIF